MDGRPYMAARFAASLRRKLYRGTCPISGGMAGPKAHSPEHLGLITPQWCGREEKVTSFMRPAPVPNENEMGSEEDNAVADPLSAETDRLWTETARTNREIFTEIFRPVPTNLVRDWNAYSVGARNSLDSWLCLTSVLPAELCPEGEDRPRRPRHPAATRQGAPIPSSRRARRDAPGKHAAVGTYSVHPIHTLHAAGLPYRPERLC
jgi:hypothetical protein